MDADVTYGCMIKPKPVIAKSAPKKRIDNVANSIAITKPHL